MVGQGSSVAAPPCPSLLVVFIDALLPWSAWGAIPAAVGAGLFVQAAALVL